MALDDGRTVIYWGGPVLGFNLTSPAVPNGAETLAAYDSMLLPPGQKLGAAYAYKGAFVRALFNSAHPEAVAGQGIACSPPLPASCITPAQQLQNWRWLAQQINALLGESWVVPSAL